MKKSKKSEDPEKEKSLSIETENKKPVTPASEEVKQPARPEISEEDKIERASQRSLLLEQSKIGDREAAQRRKNRRKQEVELQDGTKTTVEELCRYVVAKRRPYSPLFPNENAFFRLIFKLNGWDHLDPKEFIKPKVVATWINELIYNRFAAEVLPTLQKKNPLLANGFRMNKHFQYLDDEGQAKVLQFRDEAVEEMLSSKNWNDFRVRMYHKYGISYQVSLFNL